jgi:hypothetical protein
VPEVLGKLEKPSVEKFKGIRKLCLVPLIFTGKDAPRDFLEKVELYWKQVDEHLNNLEQKIGRISKVYHESISSDGTQGLNVIEQLNEKAYPLIKRRCEQGAELQATEDMDLFTQSLDWGNCLRIVMSGAVFQKVSEFYREVTEKRFNHIAQRIDKTLKDEETGALFISEGHLVQFPSTIQVFYISPPALDEIHRWFRERTEKE